MKRTSTANADCAVARSLDVIGDWWSLLLALAALAGLSRFGEFERSLGLAKNILSARLRKLVAAGILEVVTDPERDRFPRYVPTAKGKGLQTVLAALWQWGEAELFTPGEMVRELVDRETGEKLAPIEMHAADGRLLGPEDVEVRAIR